MRESQPATLHISAYWNDRAKRWDLVATGRTASRTWVARSESAGTVDLDELAGRMLLETVTTAIDSWLF